MNWTGGTKNRFRSAQKDIPQLKRPPASVRMTGGAKRKIPMIENTAVTESRSDPQVPMTMNPHGSSKKAMIETKKVELKSCLKVRTNIFTPDPVSPLSDNKKNLEDFVLKNSMQISPLGIEAKPDKEVLIESRSSNYTAFANIKSGVSDSSGTSVDYFGFSEDDVSDDEPSKSPKQHEDNSITAAEDILVEKDVELLEVSSEEEQSTQDSTHNSNGSDIISCTGNDEYDSELKSFIDENVDQLLSSDSPNLATKSQSSVILAATKSCSQDKLSQSQTTEELDVVSHKQNVPPGTPCYVLSQASVISLNKNAPVISQSTPSKVSSPIKNKENNEDVIKTASMTLIFQPKLKEKAGRKFSRCRKLKSSVHSRMYLPCHCRTVVRRIKIRDVETQTSP